MYLFEFDVKTSLASVVLCWGVLAAAALRVSKAAELSWQDALRRV